MNVNFTKMHGLGNDYIYFDCVENPDLIANPAEVARKLSDRHFGVGGDGIVLILPHDEADFRMRMFNADGSEAEMCGNAIRCVGKFVRDNGHTDQDEVSIMTGAGLLALDLRVADGKVASARVDMGAPILNGPDIPVDVDRDPVIDEPVRLDDGTEHLATCVSMGNPHAVIVVDEITDQHVLGDGPKLEVHPLFPKRINVEFVQILSPTEIRMRVWERGSGETLACGTGASASLVACSLKGLTERRATVHLLGGDLEIEWSEEDDHVFMTGPATVAFAGTVDI